jgi:PD-(D/E)XK nuclease superfamily
LLQETTICDRSAHRDQEGRLLGMSAEALVAALAVIDATPTSNESQQLVAAKCRGLMAGYHARWAESPYRIADVEYLLRSDLWNPATNRKSRSFTVAGKIDVAFVLDGKRIIVDHKTTSEDISDPLAPYWRQLVVEAQPTHYILLEWLNGRRVDGALWDVVRKPQIRPAKLSKAEIKSIVFTKQYCGAKLSDEMVGLVQSTERESFHLYEARLAQDCMVERPGWYFQRRAIPRLENEIHEHATELWDHGQEIIHARSVERWPRNSGACMLYRTPCKFLGICSGHDTPDSEKWLRKPQVHSELVGLIEGDGREVLTNSRIKAFQTCRKKHFFEYEMGIERLDEEERESLWFGTLWHAALEEWFSWFKIQHEGSLLNGHSNNESTASAVVNSSETADTF